MNINLIGMRGVGKSNVARRLSVLSKRPVMSTDTVIFRGARMSAFFRGSNTDLPIAQGSTTRAAASCPARSRTRSR